MLVESMQLGLLHKTDVQSRYNHSFLRNHKVGHVTCFTLRATNMSLKMLRSGLETKACSSIFKKIGLHWG